MPEVLAVLVSITPCLFRGYAAGSGGGCCRPACPSRICCHSRQIRHSFHYGQSNRPNTVARLCEAVSYCCPRLTLPSPKSVSGFRICHVQRKFGLQQSIGQLPSPPHCKVYAVGTAALIQTDVLLGRVTLHNVSRCRVTCAAHHPPPVSSSHPL